MYSFIFRKIHFSYDFTCAKIHFSYEMGKLKLHFSYNSYIKISQTSLIDLFGIWILYVVMGFWLWVMGLVSKDKNLWHSGSEDNSRSIILTDNQQPTTDNQPLAQLDGASVWECFPALAVGIVCVGDDDEG